MIRTLSITVYIYYQIYSVRYGIGQYGLIEGSNHFILYTDEIKITYKSL